MSREAGGGAVDRASTPAPQPVSARERDGAEVREPCLRCGVRIRLRQMGCKGGHCPNCGYPYPHGDCSD